MVSFLELALFASLSSPFYNRHDGLFGCVTLESTPSIRGQWSRTNRPPPLLREPFSRPTSVSAIFTLTPLTRTVLRHAWTSRQKPPANLPNGINPTSDPHIFFDYIALLPPFFSHAIFSPPCFREELIVPSGPTVLLKVCEGPLSSVTGLLFLRFAWRSHASFATVHAVFFSLASLSRFFPVWWIERLPSYLFPQNASELLFLISWVPSGVLMRPCVNFCPPFFWRILAVFTTPPVLFHCFSPLNH